MTDIKELEAFRKTVSTPPTPNCIRDLAVVLGHERDCVDSIEVNDDGTVDVAFSWTKKRYGRVYWHQFALVDKPDTVWCEVLEQDLPMLEATQ